MWIPRHGIVQSTLRTTYTPPLDTYTGAYLAYSLRKLRTAYTGNAVKVRRDTDNVEQDIGFDNNGNFNMNALKNFIGSNAGFVTTWYDQSGNNRNLIQTVAAEQPRIINTGNVTYIVNGRAGIKWYDTLTPPSLNMYYNAGTTLSQPNSMFMYYLIESLPTTQNMFLLDSYGTTNRNVYLINFASPNQNKYTINAGTNLISTSNANTNPSLASIFYNTTSSNLYINTTSIASGAVGSQSLDGITLGNRYANGGDSSIYNFKGTMMEFIYYNSDQSSNRTGIESNMNSYFSIY